MSPTEPERTPADDQEDATNQGVSSQDPAEGADDVPGGDDNSPGA